MAFISPPGVTQLIFSEALPSLREMKLSDKDVGIDTGLNFFALLEQFFSPSFLGGLKRGSNVKRARQSSPP